MRRTYSRREILKLGGGALSGAVLAPMVQRGRFLLFGGTPQEQEFSARALKLVQESTVIDMLAPLSIGSERRSEWLRQPESFTEAELRLYRDSGIDLFHDTTGDTSGDDAFAGALQWAAQWNGFLAHHSEWFLRITTPGHLRGLNGSGKIGFLLGLQNSDHFRTLDDIDLFFGLGQRVSQLTYNNQNRIGTGCMDRSDGGLSDFGIDVVKRMNEVGMAVDLSHCGDQTTLDGVEASAKPPLLTHTNARALNPGYPRNKTDESLQKMAAKGGVAGMTAVRSFVRDSEPTTIEHLLDHYDYVAKLIGVEHVGIGSDTDIRGGYDAQSKDDWERTGGRYRAQYRFRHKIDMDEMTQTKRTYLLTEGLIRRGYSDTDISLILGGNFQRVLGEIWAV
ncbi:MAG TPA: membrane dipeptidase [Vicinamibacteria bacterium]|nr:membrane dipeptidase [Vicinamibacteria bacterium]